MYQDAIEHVKNSIFPVFFKVQQGPQPRIGVSGTAFFVDDEGLFVTASHVAEGIPQGATLFYAGNVPYTPINQPIDIEEVFSDTEKDIFIGRVDSDYLPGLSFSDEAVRPGKSLCLSGYPLSRLSQDPDGTINVSNVRTYWQPTFAIDGIEANINNKAYKGFMTQHTSLRGMSGGPVFDDEGIVFGMDVATLTRKIPNPDNTETVVPNGVAIEVSVIEEVIDSIE